MSSIHFLREGGDENYADCKNHNLPIIEATEKFAQFAVQFHETGPKINSDIPVFESGKYKYVVLEVNAGEENKKFPKAGYYIIVGMTPRNCADMFGIYY